MEKEGPREITALRLTAVFTPDWCGFVAVTPPVGRASIRREGGRGAPEQKCN